MGFLRVLFVFAAVTLAVSPIRAETPSATERRIVAAVDAHNKDAIAMLERVTNINSGTMNPDGVREVGRVFAEALEAIGFTSHWVDGAAVHRAGHLVTERAGNGPRLLLIGHLDTVFEPDSPFQKYTLVSDHETHAPGAIDMKGGDVIIVYALRAIEAAGALDNLHVTVILTGDEERVGRPVNTSREALYEVAKNADYALAFENGDNDPKTAIIARRGSTRWRLTVTGTPSHSMNLFSEDIGPGAIYEAARILDSFREEMAGEEFLTFNPGLIVGGTKVDFDSAQARGEAFGKNNVVAEHALVTGDLRTLSIEQLERTKQTMQEIAARNQPHTSATLVFDDSYLPMAPGEGNKRLFGVLDQVSRDLGFGAMHPTDPGRAGAADIAFAARYVDMAIDGLGLLGRGDHTEDETADLDTMPMQTKRAAVLMYRLSKMKR